MTASIALYHHERWDGSGYILGLSEDQIPVEARIVAAADTIDRMTHKRPGRSIYTIDNMLSFIQDHRRSLFCPQVAQEIKKVINSDIFVCKRKLLA